jgi:hypothetical protein
MIDLYKIEGTENICSYDIDHPCYNRESTWPNFQSDFIDFKEIIVKSVENNQSLLFTRVADGEFRFLERKTEGTNIGNRHLSKPIDSVNMDNFWEGVRECDYILTQLYTEWTEEFKRIIKFRDIDFPMEFAYSIVSSKWIFKKFPDSIGIIGGSEKIKLIRELMEFEEYRNYLGIERFTDYISVPERYSSDDVISLENHISGKLEKSTAKIFIFGIGISKLAVAHNFKKYHNAIYIDVGCGISALAGTTALERPYFGGWTNFILDGYDYSKIDRLDYNDTKGINEIILKK